MSASPAPAQAPSPVPAAPKAPRLAGSGTAPPQRAQRNPGFDRGTWALARLSVLFFRHLPGSWGCALGKLLADAVWFIARRARKQMHRHMDIAFRQTVPRAQKEVWCRENFRHLALLGIEFARMKHLTRENVEQLCDLGEAKHFDLLLAGGRGVIAVCGHVGNWELCGYAIAVKGYRLKSVARPMDNPLFSDLVDTIRAESGNEIIAKYQVLWKLKKLLDRNHIITISVDQNGGTGGVFAPLFGVASSTVGSPAELHLATRAPIVVCSLNRLPDGVRHRFHVWDVIQYPKTGDFEADRKAILARINAGYEKAIRMYPEQWLWGHKRWKTRPPGEVPGPDGLPPRAEEPTPPPQQP